MLNEQQAGFSTLKKRRFADKVDSVIKRTYGNQNVDPLIAQTGPIYSVDSESFILNEKFLSQHPGEAWSEANPDGIVPVVVNPELVVGKNGMQLTDDQKRGIQFLWDRYEQQSGGILAHDMGLGKTRTCITVIATLLQQSSRSKGKSSPALKKAIIIVPKNAVNVWKSEFDKWCSDDICNVVSIVTSQKDGWDVANDFGKENSFYNVMILSYETFKKYMETYDEGFAKFVPDSIGIVICDEAHKLKNADTKIVKTLKKFKGAKLWIGVTGTPYQNNLDELCSLVQFFCRTLETFNFKKDYCKPINDALRKFKKLTSDSQKLLMELRSKLRPALHYKTNSFDIERHDLTLFVALDGHPDYFKGSESKESLDVEQVQHKMYELICDCLRNTEEIFLFEKSSYLIKACIHPQEAYKALKKYPNLFNRAIQYFDENFPSEDGLDRKQKLVLYTYSAKIRVATRMALYICEKRPGEKMIMVSGSTVLLKMIGEFLKVVLNMKSVAYDGEKSLSERLTAENSFEKDDDVRILLLSLKAGGTALTLTRANHLLLLDPDYNPSNDRQAFGRIYRPGQNRTAYFYRLLCTGTLEEVKYIRQLEKEAMGNTFKADDKDVDYNVQAPYDERDLLQYFTQTKSHVNDKLDQMQIAEFNDEEDVEGSNFAIEIKNSKKYRDVCELPEELDILRGVWESVSYCFHLHKTIDQLVQFIYNDEFEIVDGDIVHKP